MFSKIYTAIAVVIATFTAPAFAQTYSSDNFTIDGKPAVSASNNIDINGLKNHQFIDKENQRIVLPTDGSANINILGNEQNLKLSNLTKGSAEEQRLAKRKRYYSIQKRKKNARKQKAKLEAQKQAVQKAKDDALLAEHQAKKEILEMREKEMKKIKAQKKALEKQKNSSVQGYSNNQGLPTSIPRSSAF